MVVEVLGRYNLAALCGCHTFIVFCNSLDGRRPANLQTALVTWYASASE
jgi:hypothetical protein